MCDARRREKRLALASLPERHDVAASVQMSDRERDDLIARRRRTHALLRAGKSCAGILRRYTADAAGIARRRDRNRRFAGAQERVLRGVATVLGGAAHE